MARDILEVQRNPFGPQAQATEQTKRFSTASERESLIEAIEHLRTHGYVVLENRIDRATIANVAQAIDALNTDDDFGDTEFAGFKTRRLYNLVARTRALDPLLLHRDVLACIEGLLEDQIQLSIASTVDLGPGESAQDFHRDDGYYPLARPHQPLSVNSMWAIDDFREDNGATLLIPGSQLSADAEAPDDARVIRATMPAGSVLMWDGSLFHAGGANESTERRLGITNVYCRAWLRQQENQFLGVPVDVARTLPRPLQKLIGYWVANNLLGYVNDASPLRLLD